MKLNTVFLFLCLIISITSEISFDSYSIDPFKEYLKKEGFLEIIESILNVYNQDVAIISCEELAGNRKGNCKRFITEYMNPSKEKSPSIDHSKSVTRSSEDDNIKCIKKLYYFLITNTQIFKLSYRNLVIKKELRRKFSGIQLNLIFNKIIERVRDLGACEE